MSPTTLPPARFARPATLFTRGDWRQVRHGLAILPAAERRGGLRVRAVVMEAEFPAVKSAAVVEFGYPHTPHILPYARLAKDARALRRKLSALLSLTAVKTLAGTTGEQARKNLSTEAAA